MRQAIHEYGQYERLLASLSHKAHRRAQARGVVLEFDDLFQEAKATYLVATEGFREEVGVKFSTYLWRSVHNNLLRVEKTARAKQHRTDSLDREVTEDGGSMYDIIAATDIEPIEDRLERLEEQNRNFATLSDRAKLVALVLDQPPASLIVELKRTKAFQKICKAQNMAAPTRTLNVDFICAALKFSTAETRKVKAEFRKIMEEFYG